MEKIQKSITIQAPKEVVWDVLLQDESYRKWTVAFSEGSYAETDWQEGSRVLFKDGSGHGLVSKIRVHKPNEYISIEHLGVIKDGVESFVLPQIDIWRPIRTFISE